ncbi:MAG: cytochrome c [Planctomycetia bacterium]|nr:cytochrome c [Planctomycetia bacterium]
MIRRYVDGAGRGRRRAVLLLCAAMLLGCANSDVQFRTNRQGKRNNASNLPAQKQEKLVDGLVAAFGTPNEPFVWSGTALDGAKLRRAAGPVKDGSGLYREHCAHCHGVTGDGLGPTARFLNPYPRDFRHGTFKFTSTGQGMKPTRDDLRRTLQEGIAGTAMPSFKVALSEEEIADLVEYVIYLSMRGEVERDLYAAVDDDDEIGADRANEAAELIEPIKEAVEQVASQWNDAQEQVFNPPPRQRPDTPKDLALSIERGRALFLGAKGLDCTKCHGVTALGDGGNIDYTSTNPETDEVMKTTPDKAAELFALALRPAAPRNLRLNVFRGGRRPIDLYRRIAVGIKGTPMPGRQIVQEGDTPEAAEKKLTTEEIWNLVDYVLSLPYEPASRPQKLPTDHRAVN